MFSVGLSTGKGGVYFESLFDYQICSVKPGIVITGLSITFMRESWNIIRASRAISRCTLSGPWTPAVRYFRLCAHDVRARISSFAPPPPNENPESAPEQFLERITLPLRLYALERNDVRGQKEGCTWCNYTVLYSWKRKVFKSVLKWLIELASFK